MARHSNDEYGSEGSVPNQQPLQGTGASPLSIRASPEDFGGQIGQGVQKIGQSTEALAKEYGDRVNETLMTKADADFTTKLGQLKADYLSKSGMAAFNAFPAYQEAVKQAFQQSRMDLPLGAQHGFDMLGARTMGNHIADGSTYATSQLKEAQRSAGADLTNANIQAALDPSVSADVNRVNEHIGHAVYGLQMQMDENHPGLKKNENGEYGFDESTPQGQGLKAQYEAQKNDIITRIQTNRFNTLAKNDVLGAYGMYLNERPNLPLQTQVVLDSHFEPMVFNAHKDNAVGHSIAQSQDDYSKILYNPSTTGANPNNLGNVKTSEGAANNTQEFINPATPIDGVTLTANNLRSKTYEGKTLSQIGHIWTSTNADDWVKNVSNISGISPNRVPDLNNPQQLSALLKGIAAAEKSPADRAKFTDDIINQGVTASLAGHQPETSKQPPKSYATNPDGSMLTLADYYRTHSADVLAKGDAYAEKVMPGDLAFKRSVRETLGNYMSKIQANQAGQYTMDNKNVMRGITGEFTKGNPPATEAELRGIPGMNDLLNRVSAQDPRFSETIPRKIAEAQKYNITTNSANGYETITRALQPRDEEHPNAIRSQDTLDHLLGRSDGTGINMKDYKDAKPATDLPDEIKSPILKTMEEIKNANGNIDGKGESRAIQWYNQVIDAYKKNEALGDKKDPNFAGTIGKSQDVSYTPPAPSRMTQLSNWIKEATHMGNILVKNPDGINGYIPSANIEKALKLGYTKVE